MQECLENLEYYVQKIANTLGLGLNGMIVILSIIGGLFVVKFVIIRLVWAKTEDIETRYHARKTVNGIFFTSLIVIILGICLRAGDTIATYFAFLTVGLSLALQDIIKSIAGWIFIKGRRLFIVGARI